MKKEGFLNKEIAEITGMNPQTIAYYSNHGLVIPTISTGSGRGSNRLYSAKDVVKFLLIRELAKVGLSLKKIETVFGQLRHEFSLSSPILKPGGIDRVIIAIYDLQSDNLVAKIVEMPDPVELEKYTAGNTTADSIIAIKAAKERLRFFQVDMLTHANVLLVDVTNLYRKAGL